VEKPMTPHEESLPWLQRKSPFLFELVVFVSGWLGISSTWRLHRLGQPIVPEIFQALMMSLIVLLVTKFLSWKETLRRNNLTD
jgi:hypothetical protein